MHAKTGIASRRLKPTLGLLDPENTRTMPRKWPPPPAWMCSATPSSPTPRCRSPSGRGPSGPLLRPAYQGSNPISDVWSLQALRMVAQYLVRAVEDPSDDEARANMLLASSYAGVGFGNAGVHLPHGMSYPVSGMVKAIARQATRADHPLVPHGFSVILNAPAVFRFTASADPAAAPGGGRSAGRRCLALPREDAGKILAERITWFIERLKLPNGLRDIGYTALGYPGAGGGHAAAASRDQALAAAGRTEQLSRLFEDALVAW